MARTIRNYELIRELGSGHFGTVYAAVGEVPGRGLSQGKRRLVALKELNERARSGDRKQLVHEFNLLDEVKHRGVVRVFEYLQEEEVVVMEYVHGVTLRKMLDECKAAREQVFTEAAVELICELADALYQAFTTPSDNGEPLNLVHRDLKPENIMVTPSGEVKILDFGLARVDNTEYVRERSDRIKGTPIYMAPEQARGEEVSHHSDLFSLGLIAYEVFLNQPAYTVSENGTLNEVFDMIESGSVLDQRRELETKLPGIGPVIAKLLQPNPAQRYRTGQDLLVDLRRQLYRDRGSHLEEFCEFFFGSIHQLPDPPEIEASSLEPLVSSSGRRMTMEERLKASMARDNRAREEAEDPSWQKEKKAPAGRRARRAKGAEPSSKAPEPTTPPSPLSSGAPVSEAQSPDGMLQMVSLSNDFGPGDDAPAASATAFFALPAPKDKAPAAPPGASPVAPGSVAPTPVVAGPVAQGPVAQGPIAQGPAAQGQQADQVASYPAGQSATPFQVSGDTPPPPADHGARTQSNRVYAILLAMFFLVGVAVFVAVWFRPGMGDSDALADIASEQNTGEAQTIGSTKPDDGADGKDTAEPSVEEDPRVSKPKPAVVRKPTTNTQSSGSSGSRPSSPGVGSGTIRISIIGGAAVYMEVTCPSSYRKRAYFSAGSASVTGVPPGEQCTAFFKGGAPSNFPVRGGQSLRCTLTDTTANCQ